VAAHEGLLARAVHAWHGTVFAHADAVAACLPSLHDRTSVLALTADGGALLDLLLARNPRLRPVDPETVLADAIAPDAPRPDVVLLADVLHHVAPDAREGYLRRIRERVAADALFIVKEFAPGGVRSRLGWITDRALSGDAVRFLTPPELRTLAARALPGLAAFWTPLYDLEPPNYCLLFRRLRLDRMAQGLGA
jgi:hypothetical protein